MPIVLKNGAVFLHVPKTGGNWTTCILENEGLIDFHFGHKHSDASHMLVPPLRAVSIGKLATYRRAVRHFRRNPNAVFLYTVRNPFGWYESWFKYQSGSKRNWHQWGSPPDPIRWHVNSELNDCRAETFDEFVVNVCETVPGYVTRLFGRYRAVGKAIVLKNENLASDFCDALDQMRVPHDRDRILSTQRIGESEKAPIIWSSELRARVAELDSAAFEEYGYSSD